MRRLTSILLLIAVTGCGRDVPTRDNSAVATSDDQRQSPTEGSKTLNAQTKLAQLTKLGFQMAGESVPLGFDVSRISATTSKLPKGIDEDLQKLFAESWPSDFFLGSIELIGPDRINEEHEGLYPGLTIIRHGFICIGSDGAGTMFSYCVGDRRVYLLPNENFSDDGLQSNKWVKIETTPENIKSVAVQSWDSLDALFDWALVELRELEKNQKTK